MKITSIKQQIKNVDRYSVFVDGKYEFSLSESALLDSKLASGQELSKEQIAEYKQLSAEDKLYGRALRYVAMRPRSQWEVQTYLERKDASPTLVKSTLNKLTKLGLLDDLKLARAYVADKTSLSPTSRRKIILGLRQKRLSAEVIDQALGDSKAVDSEALLAIIARKRRQTKYKDDLKLMQYLARQGFNYSDIKAALSIADET